MSNSYKDATIEEVGETLENAWKAFREYRLITIKEKAIFLRTIAKELELKSSELITTARTETHLEEVRLKTELKRTLFQLTSYAEACEEGSWLEVKINTVEQSIANSQQPTIPPDLRKILIPLGPVVVFGASNFPFAYSTAGGDTACALAAGCPVIVKAHPAHAATSELAAEAVKTAAEKCGLPKGVFAHLYGASFATGKALVQHPLTSAVGFTGSFEGGKALFDLANQRLVPIPVFAEMGSVNPVFILPGKLREDKTAIATMLAVSITQSAGQFCTNPGILVGIEDEVLNEFKSLLSGQIHKVRPAKMLHERIAKSFHRKRQRTLAEEGVTVAGLTEFEAAEDESIPTLAEVKANLFLKNPLLHKEVFGPFSLLVICKNLDEMHQVALAIEGQLTCSLMATEKEVGKNMVLLELLKDKCGRFVLNGVPTGVEVVRAMHHGGPFPATTDSRFTAVGADGIKRFARPICFQNWPDKLLPVELRNENALGLWRMVNNKLTREKI